MNKMEFYKGFKMANRAKILESFSSKYRSRKGFHDDFGEKNHKKKRPNWDADRRRKQSQWEDDDER